MLYDKPIMKAKWQAVGWPVKDLSAKELCLPSIKAQTIATNHIIWSWNKLIDFCLRAHKEVTFRRLTFR